MSKIYKKMYPKMKLVRTELVLIPFRSKFYFDFKFSDLTLVSKFPMSQNSSGETQKVELRQATLSSQFGQFLADLSCISSFLIF